MAFIGKYTDEQFLNALKQNLHILGWTRGINQNQRGEVCLGGAVNKTLFGAAVIDIDDPDRLMNNENYCQIWARVPKLLGFNEPSELVCWNDRRERTFEEVIQRIDDALLRVQAQNAEEELIEEESDERELVPA